MTPEAPIRADTVQSLKIAGLGFKSGLAVQITDPTNVSFTIPAEHIQNLQPTSFEAAVMLRHAGRYSIVVQQDGQTSGAFALDVRNDPATAPRIENASPSQTVVDTLRQPVALIGVNFDASLVVHVVDPDDVLTALSSPDVSIERGSLVQFSMVFNKVGTYRFSLWKPDGQVSNTVDVRVR